MKKVLLITDPNSLELTRAVLQEYLSNSAKLIGKILILKPTKDVADFYLGVQPTGYEEVGQGIKAQWHSVLATYHEGYEPFLLQHVFADDKFDLIIAVDSLAAESCLAGREPGAKQRAIVLRSSPKAIVPYNVRAGKDTQSITTRFLREAVYADMADRIGTVFIANDKDKSTIANGFEFITDHVPMETIEFPVMATLQREKQAIRSTLSSVDGNVLKPEDKVICVKLPTTLDIAIRQSNIAGLLELIFELSAISGKTTQPKWLILCGTPAFRYAIKNATMPPAVTNNVMFMGRSDAETFFDTEAMATALLACDMVVDCDRDHGYDIFTETAMAWGIPVVGAVQGNIATKTTGTNLLGVAFDVDSTVQTIKHVFNGEQPVPKPQKRTLNHTLLRIIEND